MTPTDYPYNPKPLDTITPIRAEVWRWAYWSRSDYAWRSVRCNRPHRYLVAREAQRGIA